MPVLNETPYVTLTESPADPGSLWTLLGSAGTVEVITCLNESGAKLFVMLFDTLTEPVTTVTAPEIPPIPIPDDGYLAMDMSIGVENGCQIALSSTSNVWTAVDTDAGTGVYLYAQGKYA